MADLRSAGVGFPNGAVNLNRILALPTRDILLLNSEHWHHDALVAADKRPLWRAVPEKTPAKVKWSVSRYVDQVLLHTDAEAVQKPIRAIIPWNEWDLNYERGDGEDDLDQSQWASRYVFLGSFQYAVVGMLQTKIGAEIHYGAWTPDHGALDYVQYWRKAAEACDVVDFHAYDSLEQIQRQYAAYRQAFPTKRLALTEWHCKGDLAEERRVLAWLSQQLAVDPLFEAAYFFIWRWENAPGWWSDAYDIEHNPDRLALFMDPPAVTQPDPAPEPEPIPVTWNRADLIKLISDKALASGLEPYELLGGAIAESNLDPNAFRQGDWPDVSAGMFQQTVAFAKEGDRSQSAANIAYIRQLYSDPVYATDRAIEQYSYWRKDPDVLPLTAWAAYNGGGGFYKAWYDSPNLGNYRRALLEAATLLGVKADVDGAGLGVAIPPEVIGQQNDWTCSVRSTYAALWTIDTLAGRTPLAYDEVYQAMVPKLADASVGLHRADGSELAVLLQARGLAVETVAGASLPRVQARAGKKLVLLGFTAWGPAGHWVFCHGVSDDGVLQLSNPAGTYQGIGEILRDTFPKLGSCTMLAVDVPTALPVPVPVPAPTPIDPRITELEAQVAQLTLERDQALAHTAPLVEGLAYVGDDVMDAIQAAVDAVRRVRAERVGPRPTKA